MTRGRTYFEVSTKPMKTASMANIPKMISHQSGFFIVSEVDQDDCDDCSDGDEGCEEEWDAEKDAVHKPRIRVFPVEAGDNAALDTTDIVSGRMSPISMSVQNMWTVFEIVRGPIPEPDETVLILP